MSDLKLKLGEASRTGLDWSPGDPLAASALAEIVRLESRETELQADNTRLVNEVRMLRAQLGAAKAVMRVALIERPMMERSASRTDYSQGRPPDPPLPNEDLFKLYERVELLEKDAWTQTGAVAKQFVKAAKEYVANLPAPDVLWPDGSPSSFIEGWREKFKLLVGDE